MPSGNQPLSGSISIQISFAINGVIRPQRVKKSAFHYAGTILYAYLRLCLQQTWLLLSWGMLVDVICVQYEQMTNMLDIAICYKVSDLYNMVQNSVDVSTVHAKCVHMMTSSNGDIFLVTGHLCGEFTGHRWVPRTKANDAELWCFLWSALE